MDLILLLRIELVFDFFVYLLIIKLYYVIMLIAYDIKA